MCTGTAMPAVRNDTLECEDQACQAAPAGSRTLIKHGACDRLGRDRGDDAENLLHYTDCVEVSTAVATICHVMMTGARLDSVLAVMDWTVKEEQCKALTVWRTRRVQRRVCVCVFPCMQTFGSLLIISPMPHSSLSFPRLLY